MSGRFWALAVICSVFGLLHCGGTVHLTEDDVGGGGRGHAGRAGRAGGSNPGSGSGGMGSASPLDAGFDVYVDPGCPDVGAPERVINCDPFATTSACPPGEGCFPFVEQPQGLGCDPQKFGTMCRPAGSGQQGDSCGNPGESCGAGFVCVVGSQPGKHCVQLCPIGSQKICPAGMICGELDVEGFGVCS